ncbi:NAD(P)/FAD-dependent oxidoreductase [Pseudomonas sp. Y24-6]|uniref:NAD(P)/FAD-dependent oxidoreductase n=1 Tax=Pseudomonas sp. Y24-6 TaxID=2750013 RepID=UPI001CE20EBE|nr:NAD(P)/FAD-dependent oxidoreductase [Pseudomonas sp. Y24-6]
MTHGIVIVGGGAGGLALATRLGNTLGKSNRAHVTLVDTNLTHIWKPLLHEVAVGSLNPSVDELNYVAQAKWNHFHFQYGRMSGLSREDKKIRLATSNDGTGEPISGEREIGYDTLVLAVGSQSNDFGIQGVQEHCLFLDSRVQAERLHRALLSRYLRAHASNDTQPLCIAVVGAGATGVELCAELHHAVRLMQGYGMRQACPEGLSITLIEAGPRTLPILPERISQAVHRELQKLGVEVLRNCAVSKVTGEGVIISGDELIQADVRIWAAGIRAPAFLQDIDGLETNRINQLAVQSTLQTTRDESIFAMGDCAACPIPKTEGRTVPPRAQAAHQQAEFMARNIALRIEGKSMREFHYKDYGTLVSLGSFSAVGTLKGNLAGSLFIEGFLAKAFYLSLYRRHQASLYGVRKVIFMMIADFLLRKVRPRLHLH